MAPNPRLVVVGISKQTAKGAAAATPTFLTGVTDGKPASWEIAEDVIEATSTAPLNGEVDRKSVVPGMDYTALVHPKVLGLLLFGALGSITTVGAGAPYAHTIVPATDVPYLTAFGKAFGADWAKVVDCKIDELEIKWDGAGHLEISVTMMGLVFTWNTSAFPAATNDESVGGTPLFRAAGGTFSFAASGAVPAAANITKGSIKISNNNEGVPQSGSVQPGDIAVGVKEIDVDLTIVPPNMNDLRAALTGDGVAGTNIAQVPVYGSFSHFFTIDANTDLTLAASRVQAKPEMPDADPGGGFLEIGFKGAVLQPNTGAAFTATVHNSIASY